MDKMSYLTWAKDIPSSWKIVQIKYHFNLITGFTPSSENEEYFDNDNGLTWVTIGDLSYERNVADSKSKISNKYVNEKKPQIVPKGSLLYSYKLSVGQVAFAGKDLYTNEAIASFIPNKDLSYLYYASSLIEYNANENIYGAKLLNQELIKNAYIALPPKNIQDKIVEILDDKCSKINDSILNIEKQIEYYKQLKTSIITEAVFGSLNSKKKKNSGYEWIGNIPFDWTLKPFRYILKERKEKNNPILSTERLSLSIDKGITLYSEKTTNLDRFKDDFSKYKLAYPGDLVMNSMNVIVGAVGVSKYFGCISPAYYSFYDDDEEHVYSKYVNYIYLSKPIRKVLYCLGKGIYSIDRGDDKINTCRLKVPVEEIKKMYLPVPSRDECIEIVSYLDKKIKTINDIINLLDKELLLLNEYKKTIVYEYVTGKKEVI